MASKSPRRPHCSAGPEERPQNAAQTLFIGFPSVPLPEDDSTSKTSRPLLTGEKPAWIDPGQIHALQQLTAVAAFVTEKWRLNGAFFSCTKLVSKQHRLCVKYLSKNECCLLVIITFFTCFPQCSVHIALKTRIETLIICWAFSWHGCLSATNSCVSGQLGPFCVQCFYPSLSVGPLLSPRGAMDHKPHGSGVQFGSFFGFKQSKREESNITLLSIFQVKTFKTKNCWLKFYIKTEIHMTIAGLYHWRGWGGLKVSYRALKSLTCHEHTCHLQFEIQLVPVCLLARAVVGSCPRQNGT